MKASQEQKILDVWKETTFFQLKRAGDEEQNKVLKAVNQFIYLMAGIEEEVQNFQLEPYVDHLKIPFFSNLIDHLLNAKSHLLTEFLAHQKILHHILEKLINYQSVVEKSEVIAMKEYGRKIHEEMTCVRKEETNMKGIFSRLRNQLKETNEDEIQKQSWKMEVQTWKEDFQQRTKNFFIKIHDSNTIKVHSQGNSANSFLPISDLQNFENLLFETDHRHYPLATELPSNPLL